MSVQGKNSLDIDRPLIHISENGWYHLLAFGAVVLVALVHSAHDAMEGTLWVDTVAPFFAMVSQAAVLSIGHRWLRDRNAGAFMMRTAGVLVSALFGVFVVQLHANLELNLYRGAVGTSLGLGTGAIWALAFRVPRMIPRANLRALSPKDIRREDELIQLRSCIHPHFLQNTLYTIAAINVDKPVVARGLMELLGDLFQDVFQPDSELRPFWADLGWLRGYAEILEARHGDSIHFEWDVAFEMMIVPLPKLLLQPLLENAARHGALRRPEGGVVTLRTSVQNETLRLIVEDNGPGFAPGTQDGLGLRIVRERVGAIHPSASLNIKSSPDGTRATIEIPHFRKILS